MSRRRTNRFGNKQSSSFWSDSDSDAASATETPPIENNASRASNLLPAEFKGRLVHVRVRTLEADTSDASSSSESEDESDMDDIYELEGATDRSANTRSRAGKWRGKRPAGDWRARAKAVDYTSSRSIESKLPKYSDPSGKRYGQHPFPLSRLLDENGERIKDKIRCYKIVAQWRQMTPNVQQREIDILERQRREQEKLARKRATDDKRNRNKREKRKQKKAENAASAAANEEQGGDEADTNVSML